MSADHLAETVTVQWYLKEEQPLVTASWQACFAIASILMSFFGARRAFLAEISGRSTTSLGFKRIFETGNG